MANVLKGKKFVLGITGSIAEAAYSVPSWIEEKALSYLDAPLLDVVHRWKQYLGSTK